MNTRQTKLTDYESFIEKFEPKKTTDDCYTPRPVFDAVLEYVDKFVTPLHGREIVRPFWPGGDYQSHDYPDGCIVIDNPPFSITGDILKFYTLNSIPFFLFCNGTTAMNMAVPGLAYHIIRSGIIFENGANISIAFVTNVRTNNEKIVLAGWLDSRIAELNKKPDRSKKILVYPKEVLSSALLFKYVCKGFNITIPESACIKINGKDKPFGGGMLVASSVVDELEREREREREREWERERERERKTVHRVLSPDSELARKTLNGRYSFKREDTDFGFTFV